MEMAKVLGRPDDGAPIVEHDGITEWADCPRCGAHLDPVGDQRAPEDWGGECWICGCAHTGLRDGQRRK